MKQIEWVKGGIVKVDGEVIVGAPKFVDRGRPKNNQAGLPATRGIGHRRIDGSRRNERALPRFGFSRSTQAVLSMQQRETDNIEADDTLEQRELAAKEEGRLWMEHGALSPVSSI